jgi:hypothetical protein
MPRSPVSFRLLVRVLGKIIYWLAVLAVSIALLIALVLFFESRDGSQLDSGSILLPLLVGRRGRA